MATYLQLYGTKLDRELGSSDRTARFTTVLRKEYVNEGQQKFNEHTGCYVKRASLAITDGQQEYDLEASGVISAQDFLWPAKTTASLRRYDGSGSDNTDYAYQEGPDLTYTTEEELNQEDPGWRAHAAGTPQKWYIRADGGSTYFGLHPTPDVTSGETWTVYWPYVAQPADMTDDTHEPFGNASPRTTLRPYHDAILYYAAGLCELLRKNTDGYEWQMKRFAAMVAKYRADQQPKQGSRIRLVHNYYRSLRSQRPLDPVRWP